MTSVSNHTPVFEEASRKWKEEVESEAAILIEKEGLPPQRALAQAELNIAQRRRMANRSPEEIMIYQKTKDKIPVEKIPEENEWNKPDNWEDMATLARSMGIRAVNIEDYPVTDRKVLRMVSADHAKMYSILPLGYNETSNTLTLAFGNIKDPTIIDDMSLMLGCHITPVLASKPTVDLYINNYYGEQSHEQSL
jgi:hypothetical protein